VIRHFGSFGSEEGLWELAVLKFKNDGTYTLTYDTDIADDVIGHLTPYFGVTLLLREIRQLQAEVET